MCDSVRRLEFSFNVFSFGIWRLTVFEKISVYSEGASGLAKKHEHILAIFEKSKKKSLISGDE